MCSRLALTAGTWTIAGALMLAQPAGTPESKAVAYLSTRAAVAQNPDAVRALLMAGNRGHNVAEPVKEARAVLQNPAGWNASGEDAALKRLQFAAALAAAGEREVNPAPPLIEAAKLILQDQQQDGSWLPEQQEAPASPSSWGTAIGTWMARSTLIASGREPDDFAVAQTDRWLRTVEATTVSGAAGVLLGLGVTSDVMADKHRAKYLNLLRFAQRESGGWGAMPNAESATAFDTALVVLALQQLESDPRLARSTFRPEELRDTIAKGRAFLTAQQQADGSWPETVRNPATPLESERVATTAWALIALLAGQK